MIVCANSAGCHLTAIITLIPNYNEDSADFNTSCITNVLGLFNPVIDNGSGGYGYKRIEDAYKDSSPLHNIMDGTLPTIIYLGANDGLISVETAMFLQILEGI
jgi:hypothetical protein